MFLKNENWIEQSKQVGKDRQPIQMIKEADYSALLENPDQTALAVCIQSSKGNKKTQEVLLYTKSTYREGDISAREIHFKNGIPTKTRHSSGSDSTFEAMLLKKIPEIGDISTNDWRTNEIIALNRKNIEEFQREVRKIQHKKTKNQNQWAYHQLCIRTLERALLEEWQAAKKTEFLAEGGTLEFFPDHLKTIRPPQIQTESMARALNILLDRHQIPARKLVGKTWKEIREMVIPLPKDKVEGRHDFFHHGFPWADTDLATPYPKDFQLPDPKKDDRDND